MSSQTEAPGDLSRDPAVLLDTLQQLIARLAEPLDALTSIGIAAAAPSLAPPLAAKFGVPVTVESGARAATWGEFRFGGHRVRSLLAVFVGAGVGSGAVVDGALASAEAEDLGHTRVVTDGLACPCGGRGCLEQYASSVGFQRRLRAALEAGTPTSLREATGGDAAELTADMVAAAANSGDALARALWSDARRALTLGIAGAVTRLSPETLVLGGAVLDDVPELVEEITGGVMAATSARARESLRIERARLGEWAGVLGAAALGGGLRPPSCLGGGLRPPSDAPRA